MDRVSPEADLPTAPSARLSASELISSRLRRSTSMRGAPPPPARSRHRTDAPRRSRRCPIVP